MASADGARLSPRHCPRCGALGILPLDQPHDRYGQIPNPRMICPYGHEDFVAHGMTWGGAFRPDLSLPDEELEAQITEWVERMLRPLDEE
ncbi:MAG TPA: hypothetical protein VEI83_09695 [Acidimicrobiales bacterium]|nr:hypothetical protein [Acidimicrobiales bacterium]